MLHKDVLIRLCQARDLLRETEDRMYTVSEGQRADRSAAILPPQKLNGTSDARNVM